tara:strand:+ start:214 stop:921 length:708 start_codon:yes stop_codon:yes gene_type:complete
MIVLNPKTLSNFFDKYKKLLFFLFLAFSIISLGMIIFIENDYYQGVSFKIMFIHVPAAWLSLMLFGIIGTVSIIGLVFKSPTSFIIARAISPIGLLMSITVLVTGSIWGYLTWGAFWVWDARLTSMLILTFIYLGHLILLNSFEHFQKSDFAASILAVIGLVNLPVVKFSVNWWTTLHQGASVFKIGGPSLSGIYLTTLMISFFCILILCLYWIINIFVTITETRRYERRKLFNE